ncbi:MAG TPA: class I SAM-dependent methyltransferase [Thermoplasmata archaeon]|nr:class I SAM-dependent methyltransferase [Thermoplasmata archaeon]
MPSSARRSHPRRRTARTIDHVRQNLKLWERVGRSYERRHARVLGGRGAEAWGMWRTPERSLGLLGKVQGLDVLELGCGAARWSYALRDRGARPVGLDFSPTRLRQARASAGRRRAALPLVRANAERLPFRAGTFDLVFCDWGAMTFCDPAQTVPEVSRVLRSGGRFVFSNSSPFRSVAQDRRTDRLTARLRYPYFDLGRLEFHDEVNFQLPTGRWIDLFRAHGLAVERLVESRPSGSDRSGYLNPAEERWARRWPMEWIWQLRRD